MFPETMELTSPVMMERSMVPSMPFTTFAVTLPPPSAIAWSVRLRASRMLPLAATARSLTAASSEEMFSAFRIFCSSPEISSTLKALSLNCMQRERMVTGSFSGSVVARMNFTYSGGSSRVFRRALKLLFESMCTSSMR